MGICYGAAIVYGVPYKSVRKTIKVTKYNENTGRPYETSVVTGVQVLVLRDGTSFPYPVIVEEREDDFMDNFTHGFDEGAIGILSKSVDCNCDLYQDVLPVVDHWHECFVAMAYENFPDSADVIIKNARLMLVNTSG